MAIGAPEVGGVEAVPLQPPFLEHPPTILRPFGQQQPAGQVLGVIAATPGKKNVFASVKKKRFASAKKKFCFSKKNVLLR